MPTLTGKITIFGVAGDVTLTASGIIQPANMVTQAMGLKQNTKKADLTDGEGEVLSRMYYGGELMVSFSFMVKDAGDPGNLVNLKASIKIPEPGSKATIANATLPIYDGDWNIAGDVSIEPVKADFIKYTCTLERVGKATAGTAAARFLDDTP